MPAVKKLKYAIQFLYVQEEKVNLRRFDEPSFLMQVIILIGKKKGKKLCVK